MAYSDFSGVAKVEYDSAGNSFASAVDLGKPIADSAGVGNEPQVVETGKGTNVYAGVKKEHVFNILDMSKFSALETIMKADSEIDVRITDVEGNTETIAENASVQVKKVYATAVGTRNYFEMKIQYFDT